MIFFVSTIIKPRVSNAIDFFCRLEPALIISKNLWSKRVILVGFSGGGGAAALLAAMRQDVVFLGTIAGNLDTEAWTQLQGISPLAEPLLNPITVAPSLQHLPQRHLSSNTDAVMPPEISAAFCRAAKQPKSCVVISGVAHGGPWQEYWDYTYLLQK